MVISSRPTCRDRQVFSLQAILSVSWFHPPPGKRLTGPLAFGFWLGAIEGAGGRGVVEKLKDFTQGTL